MEEFVTSLVRRVGSLLLADLGRTEAFYKGVMDIVTSADMASQRLMMEAIRERYPEHAIFSEEGPREEKEYTWFVDPLDGTINYYHGYPVFCVSVALSKNGDMQLGAIYDPLRDELFYAERESGARLNGEIISVSKTSGLLSSLVATGFPYQKLSVPDNNVREFGRVVLRVQGLRRAGSAALDLAYVACGRLDGYWEKHVSPWDWAAGVLLVSEAGGRVTDLEGNPWRISGRDMVATNGLIHGELLGALKEAWQL